MSFHAKFRGFFDGITRKAIISLAEEIGMKVNVSDLTVEDILSAEELFLQEQQLKLFQLLKSTIRKLAPEREAR